MEIRKTHKLPADPAEALATFRRLVREEPFVLFVVIGTSPDDEALVSKAGKFAGSENDPRWVVWTPTLDPIRTEIATFKDRTGIWQTRVLDGAARSFTLSVGDEIRGGFAMGDTFDNMKVWNAWREAETS